MPTINPLLFGENDEINALAAPAEALTPPTPGAMEGFGTAVAITAENTAKATWQFAKEQVERSVMGDQAYEALGGSEVVTPAPKMEKIDPLTTGTAAQILGPLAFDIPASILSLGAATGVAALREREVNYQELREKGVDKATARQAADVKGLETAAMFGITRIPFAKAISQIGSPALRLATKAGVGAATMTGMDFVGSESRAAILNAHGYHDQAAQLQKWDAMRIAADAIGGAMLGLTTRAPVDEATELAARVVREDDHIWRESGPGLPTTPEMSGATADATVTAINHIRDGQPVNVGDVPELFDGHFLMYQEKNIKTAESHVADHDKIVKHYDSEIAKAQKIAEQARKDGMHDVAQHYEDVEIPQLQNIRRNSERLADQWRDDVTRLKDPDGMTPAGRAAEPHITEHGEAMADIRAKAETFKPAADPTTPAAMAQAGETTRPNVAEEARQMLQEHRNPVQEATAGSAAAPPPKLTPEQQELVDMHHELRQLADATGDAELHAELDNAMALHEAEHMEANKFNVAALCAIG